MKNSLHTPPVFSESLTPGMQTLLDRAEAMCTEHGARLTAQRREILGLILKARAPVGAYDLLEQIKSPDRKPAPPTVYRALEFLLEQGLIHRIERLSAFVPCAHLLHQHHTHDCAQDHTHNDICLHTAQFLICRSCHTVIEITTPTVLSAVKEACAQKNFTIQSTSIEIEGLCQTCAPKAQPETH